MRFLLFLLLRRMLEFKNLMERIRKLIWRRHNQHKVFSYWLCEFAKWFRITMDYYSNLYRANLRIQRLTRRLIRQKLRRGISRKLLTQELRKELQALQES